MSNRHSDIAAPYLYKRNKNEDHVAWFARSIDTSPRINEEEQKLNGKRFRCFYFRTLSSDILKKYYHRWYPSEGGFKKVVPKDITLTTLTVMNWFLDDGSSYLRKRGGKQIIIVLSSQSFSKEDNQFLCDKLKADCGVEATVNKTNSGTGWRIHVKQSSTETFFKFIGKCPVKSLEYKWK